MIKLCDIVVYHGEDIETTGTIFGSPVFQYIANMTSHSLVSPQKVLVLTPWHSDESESSGRIAELQNCLVHS